MDIQEIISKYLPMLHDLQKLAAEHGMHMDIQVSRDYVNGYIARYDESDEHVLACESSIFYENADEKHLDENYIKLSAFFASQCVTTVTGVDCPIIPN